MMNYFEIIAQKMSELGLYNYLFPFVLVTAVVYALLRKSKLLGESALINGLISLVIGFMAIFGFPLSSGMRIAAPLATFFMQVSVFVILFFIAFLISSLFYPNLSEWISTAFKSRNTLFMMIGLAIGLFVTSGLVGIFMTGITGPSAGGGPTTPRDVIIISAGVIIFIIMLIVAAAIGRGGK